MCNKSIGKDLLNQQQINSSDLVLAIGTSGFIDSLAREKIGSQAFIGLKLDSVWSLASNRFKRQLMHTLMVHNKI